MTNHELVYLGSPDMMRLTHVMMGCTPRVYWDGESHNRIPVAFGAAWPLSRASIGGMPFMLTAYAVLN